MSLNLFKYVIGSNREPSVGVGLYSGSRGITWDNPIQLVSQAGVGFEQSPIHDCYLANQSQDIDYDNLRIFSVDTDTSTGSNEASWFQFRVLDEDTGKWSIWTSNLVLDNVLSSSKVLRYFKGSEDDFGDIRDVIRFQVRVSIPTTAPGQMKEDLVIFVDAGGTEPNTSGGRP